MLPLCRLHLPMSHRAMSIATYLTNTYGPKLSLDLPLPQPSRKHCDLPATSFFTPKGLGQPQLRVLLHPPPSSQHVGNQ